MRGSRGLLASGFVLALGCCLLQLFVRSQPSAFLNLAPSLLPAPRLSHSAHLQPQFAESSDASRVGAACWMASILGAAAAVTSSLRSRNSGMFTGSGSAHVIASNMLVAQEGDAVDCESLITMGQIPRRPHKRICEKTWKDWNRGRRVNKAARVRFLIRPDGTIWRRQPGLRHLISKKSPARLRRLRRMVRVRHVQYKRVQTMLKMKIKRPQAEDFIMRKFNERRLNDGLGMKNNVGTSMWT